MPNSQEEKLPCPRKAPDGFEGSEEGLGGQVLGFLNMTRARQVIAVDTGQVAVVELGESIRVVCGTLSQFYILWGQLAVALRCG